MNINDLTIGQAKELANLLQSPTTQKSSSLDAFFIGKHVIVRTYSAGVFFGIVDQKSSNEIILKDARRLWLWYAKEGISLSSVALYGINESKSKIAAPVEHIWLDAIEVIPTTDNATKSISGAKNAKAE